MFPNLESWEWLRHLKYNYQTLDASILQRYSYCRRSCWLCGPEWRSRQRGPLGQGECPCPCCPHSLSCSQTRCGCPAGPAPCAASRHWTAPPGIPGGCQSWQTSPRPRYRCIWYKMETLSKNSDQPDLRLGNIHVSCLIRIPHHRWLWYAEWSWRLVTVHVPCSGHVWGHRGGEAACPRDARHPGRVSPGQSALSALTRDGGTEVRIQEDDIAIVFIVTIGI